MSLDDPLDYGVVKLNRGSPPSRNGQPTMTVVLPVELARAWPDTVTHVRVLADHEGLHLIPLRRKPRGPDRPPPFAV